MSRNIKIAIALDPTSVEYLRVLASDGYSHGFSSVEAVISFLVHSAVDGMRRPGSWERGWLTQAFGSDWVSALERDPACPTHDIPRTSET